MAEDTSNLAPDTRSIHADRDLNDTRAVVPPIWQTATFLADSPEEFERMATEVRHDRFYTRYGNPTHSQTAAVIAALEGAEATLLTASGMGAITSAVLALVDAGDHVVAQTALYSGTAGLTRGLLPRFGVETTFVDQRSVEAFERALRPETKLFVLETPSNPLMWLTDLRAVADLASAHGVTTIVDNTFATPINQRPLDLGVDLVAHSATKFLGGHSDLVAGAIAGRADMLDRIWEASIVLGATLGPLDSWLLLRGLRTLPLRIERHNANAMAVARSLDEHAAVDRVYYAGLESHPQYELARRQMSGFGGVVSFELTAGYDAAERMVSRLRLARRAASLGGVESLVVHPASMWASTMTREQFEEAGIRPGLVRFSVGLEAAEDLIADLERALG